MPDNTLSRCHGRETVENHSSKGICFAMHLIATGKCIEHEFQFYWEETGKSDLPEISFLKLCSVHPSFQLTYGILASIYKGCTCSFSLLAFTFLWVLLPLFSFFLSIIFLSWYQTATLGLLRAETLLSPHTASAAFLSANKSESNLCFPGVSVSIKLFMSKFDFVAEAVWVVDSELC